MKYLILTILILGLGCSGESYQDLSTRMDLTSIVLQYHTYFAEMKSPPNSVESLADFDDPHSNLPGNKDSSDRMKNALASGDYVVFWGYDISANLARNESVVLAYHKDVPAQGGFVAFADGVARKLTKEEFEAASKANEKSN